MMKLHQAHYASIVVPCYNEAERLDIDAFIEFTARHREFRFVMVDDGSRDATKEVLEKLCQTDPQQFELLALGENRGKAEAVRYGMLQAAQSQAEFIGYLDADLASPLDELPRALDVLARHIDTHTVIGVRRKMLGHLVRRTRLRSWLGHRFSQVASWVLGVPIQDTQCGLKLFRNTPETLALFASPFQSRWIFDVEIFARMVASDGTDAVGSQIYELPLESWRDVPGSKLKSSDFFKALGELVMIRQTYLPTRRPILLTPPNLDSSTAGEKPRKAA